MKVNPIRQFRERSSRIHDTINFDVCTFGTTEVFKLGTVNISYTGLLLASQSLLPYQLKTIVELKTTVHLEGVQHDIDFIGKIVRLAKGNSTGLQKYTAMFDLDSRIISVFGIAIIDINEDKLQIWKHYVDSIQLQELQKNMHTT